MHPVPWSWKPVTRVETPVVPISPLMMVLMPWLVIPAPPPKDPKVAALARLGPTGPVVVPVVKFQGFGTRPAPSALPYRSFAALETVAVYWVLAVRLALGRNVAILVCES